MRVSSVVMFAIAFLCAGVAAFLVRTMVANRPEESVAITRGAPPALKTIIVAAKDIKPGMALTAEFLREAQVLSENVPKGAFVSKDGLLKAGEPRVVAVAIATNEPILPTKIY